MLSCEKENQKVEKSDNLDFRMCTCIRFIVFVNKKTLTLVHSLEAVMKDVNCYIIKIISGVRVIVQHSKEISSK